MRKSRVVTCSLGLLAAALFFMAFTLTPTASSAGTVCSCPSWWTWQSAGGSASSPSGCPGTACRINAENNARAACGAEGLCDFGSFITNCYIANGVYYSNCSIQYVCNICIDYPD
jgi:hypothetical protein